jgi:preprotein translocase subunit Sec63
MFCLTCFGRCRQSSTNCSWPMTDMLAPKSTIPEDPWDTKQAVSTGFRLPVTVGRRGSAGGGMLSAFSSVVGLFLQRACSRLVRSGRTFINWDFNGSGSQLYLTELGGKNLLGMYGFP